MLSDKIKIYRRRKGLTQDDVALYVHVSRQTVSKWERGVSVPDADALARLAELYKVGVTELLGNTATTSPQDDFSGNATDDSFIAQQLEKINSQIALRNRRCRLIYGIIAIAGVVVLLWGVITTALGLINYVSVVQQMDMYGSETAGMVISRAASSTISGIIRIVIGAIIAIASFVVRKSYT